MALDHVFSISSRNDCILLDFRTFGSENWQSDDATEGSYVDDMGPTFREEPQFSTSTFLDRRHTLPEIVSGGRRRIYWVI